MMRGNARSSILNLIMVIALLSTILSSIIPGQDSIFEPSDLLIKSLVAKPLEEGGYQIDVVVRNQGPGGSDPTTLIIWDEDDLVRGDMEIIGQIRIPGIRKGEEHHVNIYFNPSHSPLHRIWVLIDPDADIDEMERSNNIASITFEYPRIRKLSSPLIGQIRNGCIGTFLEEIPVDIPLTIELDRDVDRSLVRMYIETDDSDRKYVPYGTDGLFSTEISTLDLALGPNNISINPSIAGVPLESKNYTIIMESIPAYLSRLDGMIAEFDYETAQYLISGYLDIEDMAAQYDISGTDEKKTLKAFTGERDFLIRSRISLEGEAAISAEGNIDIETQADRLRIRMDRKSMANEINGTFYLSINGSHIVENLEIFERPLMNKVQLDDPRELRSPSSPRLSGGIDYDIRIYNTPGQERLQTEVSVDMALEGVQEIVTSFRGNGFDGPVCDLYNHMDLVADLHLSDGVWQYDIHSSLSSNGTVIDTGIKIKDDAGGWILPAMGPGADIIEGPEGVPALATIEKGPGHNRAVTLNFNGSRVIVESDNLYKSDPGVAFTGDGYPLVIWSSSMNWSDDPLERMSSMRIEYSLGTSEGVFPENSSKPFFSDSIDIHPSITSGPDGEIAMVWTSDLDGDPSTLEDTEISYSRFENGSWSEPFRITSNDIPDDLPGAAFDRDGDLWVVWVAGDGRGRIRKWDSGSNRWGLISSIGGDRDGENVISISIAGSKTTYPVISIIMREADGNHSIRTWTVKSGSEGWGTEDQTAMISSGIISDIHLTRGRDDLVTLSWREQNGTHEINWMMQGTPLSENISWSEPLPIFSDDTPRWDMVTYPLGDGRIMASYMIAEPFSNSSEEPQRGLKIIEMNNVARITDVRVELLGDYNRWENARISVDVTNIGLDPEGRVYVNLERISRDPFSGNISSVSLTSNLVSFKEGYGKMTVEFTTTLVEHQIRYVVWTGSGWGNPPAFISSHHISMPITSDSRITDINILDPEKGTYSSTVSIRVENAGLVTEEQMRFSLMGKLAMSLNNDPSIDPSSMEELNHTVESLGPNSERVLNMNVTLEHGRNILMIGMQRSDGETIFHGPFRIDIFPDIGLSIPVEEMIVVRGRNVKMNLSIENSGYDIPDPMNVTVMVSVFDMNGIESIQPLRWNLSITGENKKSIFDIDLNISGSDPGRYRIQIRFTGSSDPNMTLLDDDVHERWINILEEIESSIIGWEVRKLGYLGKEFILEISNDSNRTIGIAKVSLFNGFQNDGILIFESFVTNIKPGETEEAHLHFDLDEGLYLLSFTISAEPVDSTTVDWDESILYSMTFEYREIEEGDSVSDDNGLNIEDVNDSVLIGVAAIIGVLGVALLLRKKEGVE